MFANFHFHALWGIEARRRAGAPREKDPGLDE
jgi:hypothetical protein